VRVQVLLFTICTGFHTIGQHPPTTHCLPPHHHTHTHLSTQQVLAYDERDIQPQVGSILIQKSLIMPPVLVNCSMKLGVEGLMV